MEYARQHDWLESRREIALGILRIFLGAFLLGKAFNFFFHSAEFADFIAKHQDRMLLGGGLAHVVVLLHLFGGVLLIVGFGTRIAALVNIPILLGAVFLLDWSSDVFALGNSLSLSVVILALLCTFAWYGSGPLSLDRRLERREKRLTGSGFRREVPA